MRYWFNHNVAELWLKVGMFDNIVDSFCIFARPLLTVYYTCLPDNNDQEPWLPLADIMDGTLVAVSGDELLISGP